MAAIKLFATKERDQAHRVLEYVLDQARNFQRVGPDGVDVDFPGLEKFDEQFHPRASCREDVNDRDEPFTVWSDSE